MNRLIRPLLGGLFAFALAIGAFVLPARADKIIIHTGENIGSIDSNQGQRYIEESFGTWAMQLLGLTTSGQGVYGGLTVLGGANLTVTVNPPSGAYGLLLQNGQIDPSPVPIGETPNLPADTTLGVVPYYQTAVSSPIPVATPTGAGDSIYTLIEAQGAKSDGNSATRMFVDTSGNVFNANVPTALLNRINYQTKVGTEGVSPTAPAADTGWVAISTVECPFGATASTSCTIAASSGTIGAQLASACAGCVTSLSASSPLTGSIAGGLLNLACATCITGSGGGALAATSPLSVVGGNNLHCTTCVTNVTASGNLSSSGGTTPNITITSNPTFSSITNNNLAGSGQQFVCTTTAGIAQPCVVGGVSHFPDHGVVVLINAGDGCGSYTPCATSNSVCATGTECGNVQFSSSDQFCMTGYLANYQQTGTGNSGLDTTPNSAGWETGFSQSPQSSISQRAHFYNLTGSSLDFSSGTAHAMLAASYTCLY